MDKYALKLASRELLSRFGSLEQAARVCRARPSVLSHYQNPDRSAFMPVDVVAELEAACGERLVSRELTAMTDEDVSDRLVGQPLDEALDSLEALGDLVAFLRRAGDTGASAGVSPNDQRRYAELRRRVQAELAQLDRAAVKAGLTGGGRHGAQASARTTEGGAPLRLVVGAGES